MIGKTFGKLTVLRKSGEGPRGVSWVCSCSCGKKLVLSTFKLEKGSYKSCGCSKNWHDKRKPTPKILRKRFPLTFTSWQCMLSRCYYAKKKQACYEGIEICERWFTFVFFLQDMGKRPGREYSLDRKDSTLGYYKDNCQWILKVENSKKIRANFSPERNKKVSEGLRKAYAEGRIVVSAESRAKIGLGGLKRRGRKFQKCKLCGKSAYLEVCQKCRTKKKVGIS